MQPLLHDASGVGLERNVEPRILGCSRDIAPRVGHQVERELRWCITDDVAGKHWVVQTRIDRDEIQKRPTELHRSSDRDVVGVHRIRAPISIEQLILGHIVSIIVRAIEGRLDRQRGARLPENHRTEDAFLLIPDRHPLAVKGQPLVQRPRRHETTAQRREALHVVEDCQP
ncbi:MAG: hypothetical protein ACREA0_23235 [bacterium]